MSEYKCVFVKEDKKTIHSDFYADAETKLIQADTARAAAATYKLEANKWRDSLVGPIVKTCDENGQERFFPDTVPVGDKKLSTQQEYETAAKEYLAELANFTNRSYLSLLPEERIYFSQFFDYLAAEFESRALTENEILYINSWLSFQDRQLGESLISKRLSNLPKGERAKSNFAQLMTFGFAASAMRNDQALGQVTDQLESIGEDVESISEDVEDVNEGFGFDE